MKLNNIILILLTILYTILAVAHAQASNPEFSDVSQEDLKNIVRDFGALYTHTTVAPASTLGEVFGFEVGLIAGAAKVPSVNDLSKEVNPTNDVETLPHAGFFGCVSVPFGFKFELSLLPEKDVEDVKFKYNSFAVQWTLTQAILTFPFDLAVKIHKSNSELEYQQEVLGSNAKVNIENDVTGFQLLASQKLFIVEPYVGVGVVKVDGEMGLSGANEFFTDTNEQSASAKSSGSQIFVGTNLNLLMTKFGIEVGKILDATRISLKFSVNF